MINAWTLKRTISIRMVTQKQKQAQKRAATLARARQQGRLTQRPRQAQPRLVVPGEADAMLYAAALADPWNAPYSVGIPVGGVGLPTFKTTKYYRKMMSTNELLADYHHHGVDWGTGSNTLGCRISLSETGKLSFFGSPNAAIDNTLRFMQVDHPRIVSASIRIKRHGRVDDAGIAYSCFRGGFEGEESHPDFTSADELQVNYIPKTNWDLEYKMNVEGHPTHFKSELGLVVRSMVPCQFSVEFIVIIASNDSSPPATNYTEGDFVMTIPSITRSAPSLIPSQMANIANVASRGAVVPSHESQANPLARRTNKFINTVNSVAKDAGHWLEGAGTLAKTVGSAWGAVSAAAPILSMIL
jgi:hypothetical protein